MASLLLAIIYVSFISLGLPDGLLGAGWPVMHADIHAPLAAAGIISMIITLGTILSSLFSDRLTRRFGAGAVTAVSVGMTAAALFGFSVSSAFWMLCVWALPYGLGAGAVDAALNNFVALHFKARHMNWLHCFWGVGASVGPYIMAAHLANDGNWAAGYRMVSLIQVALTACLLLTLPLWKTKTACTDTADAPPLGLRAALRVRGVKSLLLAFFAYCAAENTVMVWACTYMNTTRGFDPETAASIGSLFYIGMMVGRLVSGFVADRMTDKTLIRVGIAVLSVGVVLTALPFANALLSVVGLLVIGLGCAPIYPSIIHSTPYHFGADKSGAIIGIEMAAAYAGSCLAPPLFGFLAQYIGTVWFPLYIATFFAVLLMMSERLNRSSKELHV